MDLLAYPFLLPPMVLLQEEAEELGAEEQLMKDGEKGTKVQKMAGVRF